MYIVCFDEGGGGELKIGLQVAVTAHTGSWGHGRSSILSLLSSHSGIQRFGGVMKYSNTICQCVIVVVGIALPLST